MAPLPVIADTYRVALNWVTGVNTETATNVIHVRKSGTNAAAVVAELDSHVTAAMWSLSPSASAIHDVVCTKLDGSAVSFPFITGGPAKWSGNGGSGDYIPQMASIVKMLTAKRGRSYRGRVYLPWVPENNQTNGVLLGTNVTLVTNAWVTFLAAMASAGFPLVVASYKLATAEEVVAVECEARAATQRRRMKR